MLFNFTLIVFLFSMPFVLKLIFTRSYNGNELTLNVGEIGDKRFYENRLKQKVEVVYVLLSLLLLALLTGLRSLDVGNDTIEYYKFFEWIKEDGPNGYVLEKRASLEAGFRYLCHVFPIDNFYFFNFCVSIFLYFIPCKQILQKSDNKVLSVLMLFALVFPFYMSGLRFAVAMTLGLMAFECIIDNKVISATILIILAGSMHYSAFILLLLLPLRYVKFNVVICILLCLVGGAVVLKTDAIREIVLDKFPSFYPYFRYQKGGVKLTIVYSLMQCLCFLGVSYFITKKVKVEGRLKTQLNLFMWAMTIALLVLMYSYRMDKFTRIVRFFTLLSICVLPSAINLLKNKWQKAFIILGILGFMYVYYLLVFYLRPDWYMITPYNFFF